MKHAAWLPAAAASVAVAVAPGIAAAAPRPHLIQSTDVGICASAPVRGGLVVSQCPQPGQPASQAELWTIAGHAIRSASGLCLTASRSGPRTTACRGGARQRWDRIRRRGYASRALRSQAGRCLTIPGTIGGPMRMRPCRRFGAVHWPDQQWFLSGD